MTEMEKAANKKSFRFRVVLEINFEWYSEIRAGKTVLHGNMARKYLN